jgi:hypothetical protein
MKTVALDPDYSRKTSRRFVAGGLAGQLFLNIKNWLGYSKQVCLCPMRKFEREKEKTLFQ